MFYGQAHLDASSHLDIWKICGPKLGQTFTLLDKKLTWVSLKMLKSDHPTPCHAQGPRSNSIPKACYNMVHQQHHDEAHHHLALLDKPALIMKDFVNQQWGVDRCLDLCCSPNALCKKINPCFFANVNSTRLHSATLFGHHPW